MSVVVTEGQVFAIESEEDEREGKDCQNRPCREKDDKEEVGFVRAGLLDWHIGEMPVAGAAANVSR